MEFGVSSNSRTLQSVLVRRPGAILRADHERWHYTKPLDGAALAAQFDTFVGLLEGAGVDVQFLPDDPDDDLADSIFTHDSSMVVPSGAIVLRPGKELRKGEPDLHRSFYDGRIPIAGSIEAPGTVEGGDCIWLDDTTIAVGIGFRTNEAGVDQLASLVEPDGVTVEAYDLPWLHGPDACLHLMSVISPLAEDLALVHAPLVPVRLYERMVDLGYELLHAPPHEFEASLGLNLNVLAVSPRHCIAIDGFDETHELMREAGCRVDLFGADELCIPCEGGPTCLTRPLLRR